MIDELKEQFIEHMFFNEDEIILTEEQIKEIKEGIEEWQK